MDIMTSHICVIICTAAVANVHSAHFPVPEQELNKNWKQEAKNTLDDLLQKKPNENVAKNVILFVGDGMSVATVFAARVYTGQTFLGNSGEEYSFSFEKFDNVAFSKTYSVDAQVSDSGSTATALLCGIKANKGTVGVNEQVLYEECSNQNENEVTSILDWSLAKGKSVGIVTTARVTHATPAAAYAHSADRYWEEHVSSRYSHCDVKDIALQLVEDNPQIQVVLGGGRRNFLSEEMPDPEDPDDEGYREDGRDLTAEWVNKKRDENANYAYVWNKDQFDEISAEQTDYLLGLFERSHMDYEIYRDPEEEPSLEEMTEKAVQILKKNENGFFLLVEGARIDHGHHGGKAKRALVETYMFDQSVKKALSMTSTNDTLIVVTADHSHAFSIQGYPTRGNDILGLVDDLESAEPKDDLPYTTLAYSNSPGGLDNETRGNLTGVDTTDHDFRQQALVKVSSSTHAGEDVAIYASGPMAHLFRGVLEQNYIAYAMAYASCVGEDLRHCEGRPPGAEPTAGRISSSPPQRGPSLLTTITLLSLGHTLLQQVNI